LLGVIVLINVPLLHYFLFRGQQKVTASVPWADDFGDPAKLAANYSSTGGLWRLRDGELIAPGVKNNPLWLKASLPHDVAVDVDVRALSGEGDVRIELFGDGVDGASGYQIVQGSMNNGPSSISRFGFVGTPAGTAVPRASSGVHLEVGAPKIEPGRRTHHRVERVGATVRWLIDGVLIGTFTDPFPLEGKGHDRVGLSGWEASLAFDNLVVTPLSGAAQALAPSAPAPGPFRDDFERATLGAHFRGLANETATMVEGTLRLAQVRNRPLWLDVPLPDNARISFSARALTAEGDVKVEAWGDGHSGYTGDPRLAYNATGYVFVMGGWRNTTSVIVRQAEHAHDRVERSDVHLEPGRWYRWVIERHGSRLSWAVDGQPFLELNDPAPLLGLNNRFFAFSGWDAPAEFDDLNIEAL
jgi:hypothetical protein